jgi:hypothetical protein
MNINRSTCAHKILPEHRNIVLMQSPLSLAAEAAAL